MKASLVFPFILLAVYVGLIVFFKSKFPDPQILIDTAKNLYLSYGYALIFLGAFFEGLFLVGFYMPGSTIVILGAAFSRVGIVSYPLVFLIGTLGLILSYIVNYVFGKYGWRKILSGVGFKKEIESAKHKLIQHQAKTMILGYLFPSSASFLSTAAGMLRIPFRRFLLLSILAQSIWSFMWGNIAYWFGMPFVEFILKYFFIIPFLILGVWLAKRFINKKIRLWGF